MQVDEPALEERIDIGISASCLGIPLFTCLNEGKVFPLLHMAGFGNGSATLERHLNADTRVRTVVYPTLSHHIKSLLHINYSVPLTMSGIYRKRAPIERYLEDIEDVEDVELYGYRVEVQYLGKASLALMMTNPPLSSAALPENVLCRYLCHKDVYINIIFSYYRYVCSRGLFSGNAANAASSRQQCLLAQLLNTLGLWNWKFTSHVRHVDVSDLPPFITAVLSVNSEEKERKRACHFTNIFLCLLSLPLRVGEGGRDEPHPPLPIPRPELGSSPPARRVSNDSS